ncbi:ImuA family protein [Roseovarius indicus]|uniref:ImuA family protein n=1 Tax=Roseovarius indicus TaxID=540747 RepID=UPI0032EF7A52
MTTELLTRRTHRTPTRPDLTVLGELTLPLARLHEICGPARHTLAMLIAAATQGPVFWITPAWTTDALNPDGMVALTQPNRFTFLAPRRAEDLLWTLEETLRSGLVPLAIAELPEPPGMTAVRRLHLAAETGAAEGHGAPLGLILTPGDGGAPGIETRWHMAQAHTPGAPGWALTRRRARTLPPKDWHLAGRPGRWRLTPSTLTEA